MNMSVIAGDITEIIEIIANEQSYESIQYISEFRVLRILLGLHSLIRNDTRLCVLKVMHILCCVT